MEGYKILTATGGEKGLKILKENNIDLIISDQRMPNMDGLDFLKQSNELCPKAIKIMLSGYQDIEVMLSLINDGYIELIPSYEGPKKLVSLTESGEYIAILSGQLKELKKREI